MSTIKNIRKAFSSPFGGIIIKSYSATRYGRKEKFSSPFGGIIIKSSCINPYDYQEKFSSPFGGIIIKSRGYGAHGADNDVLVPFRGNHYQIARTGGLKTSGRTVLVPFRGNHYQIKYQFILIDPKRVFSSPFGGIIIKSVWQATDVDLKVGSRPLSGESLSNRNRCAMIMDTNGTVLVPFRGNHYQIKRSIRYHCPVCKVLVPFRGNHYQIFTLDLMTRIQKVLVPFRGNHYQIAGRMA